MFVRISILTLTKRLRTKVKRHLRRWFTVRVRLRVKVMNSHNHYFPAREISVRTHSDVLNITILLQKKLCLNRVYELRENLPAHVISF